MQIVAIERPGAAVRIGQLVETRPDKTYPELILAVVNLYPLAHHVTLTCPAKWIRSID